MQAGYTGDDRHTWETARRAIRARSVRGGEVKAAHQDISTSVGRLSDHQQIRKILIP